MVELIINTKFKAKYLVDVDDLVKLESLDLKMKQLNNEYEDKLQEISLDPELDAAISWMYAMVWQNIIIKWYFDY